jgi:hypothetical protein
MKMAPAGVVQWSVPPAYPRGEVNVIIAVSDSTGQEVFHTFRLLVVEAARPK